MPPHTAWPLPLRPRERAGACKCIQGEQETFDLVVLVAARVIERAAAEGIDRRDVRAELDENTHCVQAADCRRQVHRSARIRVSVVDVRPVDAHKPAQLVEVGTVRCHAQRLAYVHVCCHVGLLHDGPRGGWMAAGIITWRIALWRNVLGTRRSNRRSGGRCSGQDRRWATSGRAGARCHACGRWHVVGGQAALGEPLVQSRGDDGSRSHIPNSYIYRLYIYHAYIGTYIR